MLVVWKIAKYFWIIMRNKPMLEYSSQSCLLWSYNKLRLILRIYTWFHLSVPGPTNCTFFASFVNVNKYFPRKKTKKMIWSWVCTVWPVKQRGSITAYGEMLLQGLLHALPYNVMSWQSWTVHYYYNITRILLFH